MKPRETQISVPETKVKKDHTLFWIGSALVVTVGGFFAWKYFFKPGSKKTGLDKDETDESDRVPYTPPVYTPSTPSYSAPSYSSPKPSAVSNDDFPLKKGSKGENVRKLQTALITKYGSSAVPGGADGDFGPNTEKALIKNGWPASIDETTFNVLVGSTKDSTSSIATKLYNAAKSKSFSDALAALKQIDSTQGYKDVNTEFKMKRLNGVSTTLVTGMLNTFASGTQKDQLKQQFLRMGLTYDGDKWAVAGLDFPQQIMTIVDTFVWEYPNKRIAVKANTILGTPMEDRKGYTLFKTLDSQHQLLVKTNSIKVYEGY